MNSERYLDPEIREELRKLRGYAKKVLATPESAREHLMKTGIYTKSGKLRKEYR